MNRLHCHFNSSFANSCLNVKAKVAPSSSKVDNWSDSMSQCLSDVIFMTVCFRNLSDCAPEYTISRISLYRVYFESKARKFPFQIHN